MKLLVVLGHPTPGSFNHALAAVACRRLRQDGHKVIFHDLYAEEFDPLLPPEEIPQQADVPESLQVHCEELQSAEGIVVVHPNWWGQPPAMVKGWIDRVFRPGVAYRFEEGDNGEGIPIGLLKAKAAVVLNTSNTPNEREQVAFGDPLEVLWKRCIFHLSGVHAVERRMFSTVVASARQERLAWLAEAEELVARSFPKESHNQQVDGTRP